MIPEPPPRVRREPVVDPVTGEVIRDATVERAEWIDPDDANPNRRAAKRIAGWRRADPLRNLAARSGLVTPMHLAAADRYRGVYELGVLGAGANSAPVVRIAVSGGGAGQVHPTIARLASLRQFRAARAFAGGARPELLDHVVLEMGHVSSWARPRAVDPKVATGLLIASLDLLVTFFRVLDDKAEFVGPINA